MDKNVAIVAVLNITPDSYVPESRSLDPAETTSRAEKAVADGADILELGAESTGPTSKDIDTTEELHRLLPALRALRAALPDTKISIDTYKAEVASQALAQGADMINDVSAGRADPAMFGVIAKAGCPYVLMHAKDPTPRTTIDSVQYDDVVATVHAFLEKRIAAAVAAGIKREQIIVDPGLGHFISSDAKYSFEIIRRLKEFEDLGPIFLSPSRKSFLAGVMNVPVKDRLPATLEATKLAVTNGASFIRTHDVKETRQALT